jgi:hypothetical protein
LPQPAARERWAARLAWAAEEIPTDLEFCALDTLADLNLTVLARLAWEPDADLGAVVRAWVRRQLGAASVGFLAPVFEATEDILRKVLFTNTAHFARQSTLMPPEQACCWVPLLHLFEPPGTPFPTPAGRAASYVSYEGWPTLADLRTVAMGALRREKANGLALTRACLHRVEAAKPTLQPHLFTWLRDQYAGLVDVARVFALCLELHYLRHRILRAGDRASIGALQDLLGDWERLADELQRRWGPAFYLRLPYHMREWTIVARDELARLR